MPLIHLGMPAPNRPAADTINSDAQREQQFDRNSLAAFAANNEQWLSAEHRNVYNKINASIATQQGGFYYLDAPGGTGKTYLISMILASIRSQNHIALAIASSRIPMIPSDSPIPFKRLQFQIRLAFAMTINKAQSQTLTICE